MPKGSQTFCFLNLTERSLIPAASCMHTPTTGKATSPFQETKASYSVEVQTAETQKSIEEKGLVPVRAGGCVVRGRVTW